MTKVDLVKINELNGRARLLECLVDELMEGVADTEEAYFVEDEIETEFRQEFIEAACALATAAKVIEEAQVRLVKKARVILASKSEQNCAYHGICLLLY